MDDLIIIGLAAALFALAAAYVTGCGKV